MMSTTMTFKCPCCGGYLEFDPARQKFKCLYCGQLLSEEEVLEVAGRTKNAFRALLDATIEAM